MHVTRFASKISTPSTISASVIQGSATGPVCFTTMSNLKPLHPSNELSAYADDSYLIVPSIASNTIPNELEHIKSWADSCNLRLNTNKSKEIIVRRRCSNVNNLPKPLESLERVNTLNVLGVTFNEQLSFSEHVNSLIARGHQKLYALKILRNHGLSNQILYNTAFSLFTSIFTYASPAWSGFLLAKDINQIDGIFKKAIKWGLLSPEHPPIRKVFEKSDHRLFNQVVGNRAHALHHLLPDRKIQYHTLRPRPHYYTLSSSLTTIQKHNFIYRMLFKDMY